MRVRVVLSLLAVSFLTRSALATGCALKYRSLDKSWLKAKIEERADLTVTDYAAIQEAIVGECTEGMWKIIPVTTSSDSKTSNGLYTLKSQHFSREEAGNVLDVLEVIKQPSSGQIYFRSMKTKEAFQYLTLSAIYKHVLLAQGFNSLEDVSLRYTESLEGSILGHITVYRKWPLF